MAQHVLGDALLELLHEGRPLRPRADEAHVAEHHVDELGELVEVEAAQPDPDRGAPRILRRGPHRTGVLLRIVHHGPELVDLERLPIQGHALLAEQDGAAPALPPDHDRDGGEDGREQEQGGRADDHVQHALDHAVPAAQRDLAEADDRDPVEVFEDGLDGRVLDQVRHDLDVQALVADVLDQAQQLRMLLEGQRDVELVRAVRGRHLRRLVQRAQDGNAAALLHPGRDVVEESHQPEPQLPMGQDGVRHLLTELARPRHEHAPDVVAGRPHPLEIGAQRGAAGVEGQHVEQHEEAHDRLAVFPQRRDFGLVAVVDADVEGGPQQERRGDEHTEEDGEELVDAAAPPLELVQAMEVQDGRPEEHDDRDQQHVAR